MKLYVEKDNGDLKLIAEGDADPGEEALFVDAVLDESPRLQEREFKAINEADVIDVVVNNDEPVNPKRDITVSGGSSEDDDEGEEEAPAPKRKAPAKRKSGGRRRSGGGKAKAKAKPAAKAKAKPKSKPKSKAKAKAGKKGGKKSGGSSPFKSNPSSEE